MLSNMIKNKDTKLDDDLKNKKINLGIVDSYRQKKDEDIVIGNKTKIIIQSIDKKNVTKDSEIDNELMNLWNILGVTFEFRKRFQLKLNYFSQEYQKILIECEKKKMKKIYDLILKITNELIEKDKCISYLKRLNVIIQNEINTIIQNDKNLKEAKKYIIFLKEHLLNIYYEINGLRNLITFDLINNKFDLSKMISSYILEPQFLLKLNNDLKVIKEGIIGNIFGIKTLFDPLLMEFFDDINYHKSYEAYYTLFNEIIFTNYTPNKRHLKKLLIKKSDRTNIDASNIVLNNIKKNNISASREEADTPETIDNKLYFYTKDISELENDYKNYYKTIPIEQKNIFNIKEDIYDYTNKFYPMFILKKEKGKLCLFCSINYSLDDDYSLEISHFSINQNKMDEIKNNLKDVIKFINDNKIIHKSISIDLYYEREENKFILNKNINNIMKELKFKWAKLENLDGGIRYQKMKLENLDFNQNSFEGMSSFNLSSGLIIYHGLDKMESIKKTNDFDFNLNTFNLGFLEKINMNLDEYTEKILTFFKNFKYLNNSNLNEINEILKSKNINIKLPFNQSNKILFDMFHIHPQFTSFSSLEINKKKYYRIQSTIQILIEKETNQKFYMILMKDGNGLIIAEPNNKFNKILQNKNINIYNIFNEVYQKIEPLDELIGSIYFPEINYEILSKSNIIENSSIENIIQVYNFFKVYPNNFVNNNYVINLLPRENDIVIKEHFFLAIINIDIAKEFNIPSIFSCII